MVKSVATGRGEKPGTAHSGPDATGGSPTTTRDPEKLCQWISESGRRCRAYHLKRSSFCMPHDPEFAEEVKERLRKYASKGGLKMAEKRAEELAAVTLRKCNKAYIHRVPDASTLAGLREWGAQIMSLVAAGHIPGNRAQAIAVFYRALLSTFSKEWSLPQNLKGDDDQADPIEYHREYGSASGPEPGPDEIVRPSRDGNGAMLVQAPHSPDRSTDADRLADLGQGAMAGGGDDPDPPSGNGTDGTRTTTSR